MAIFFPDPFANVLIYGATSTPTRPDRGLPPVQRRTRWRTCIFRARTPPGQPFPDGNRRQTGNIVRPDVIRCPVPREPIGQAGKNGVSKTVRTIPDALIYSLDIIRKSAGYYLRPSAFAVRRTASSGVWYNRSMIAVNSSPVRATTLKRCFFASARNPGSFIVASNARRNA